MLEFAIFDLSAAVTPVVLPTAALTITTNPSNSIFNEGDTSDTVTVDVTNTSSTVALPNNLTLSLTLPAGLTATAMTDSTGGNWVCTVGTLTCTNANGIAPNAADAVTVTVTVSGTATGGSGSIPGSVSATVSSPNFSSNVTGPLTITLNRHAAVTWASPAAIPAGTPLSSTQLNAAGNTAGTYVYTLNSTSGTVITSGTVLPAGDNTLWVTFTPSDQESYPGAATASVTLTVNSSAASAGNPTPVNFASEPVGNSTSQNVTFTFTGAGSIGTPVVVTQGATGLDFTDAGTGTCNTNGSSYAYGVSGSCTVAVRFAPAYPGMRYGAVLLEDVSGDVLATAYLSGTGTGSQVLFPPGTQTMLTPDLFTYWPQAEAVDAQSNLFFVDGNSNSYAGAVIKLPWMGSSYGPAQSPTSLYLPGGSNFPSGAMAEDGAGNLYVGVSDYISSTGSILKFPWNGASYGVAISLGSDLVLPTGIAVDGAGNLFFCDSSAPLIAKLPWTGSSANDGYGSQITLADSSALSGGNLMPQGIAVDHADNVFFLAATSGTTAELIKIPFVSGSYSPSFVTIDSTLYNARGIAIDPNGNIYVQDSAPRRTPSPVYEYLLSGVSYAPRAQLFTTPHGGGAQIALDGAGNLYPMWNSGDSGGAIYLQNRNVLPSINFPTATAHGTADSTDDPLSFILLNYGNSNLTIASAAFSTGGASFSFDASTTCPASATGSLAANASCAYATDFTPSLAGSIPGSLLLTDNDLNVSGATQSISLHGTGTASISFTLPEGATLPAGTVGAAYSVVTFQANGGTAPYHYAIGEGSLPPGMTLSAAGLLTGTPTAGGVFSITVLATDAESLTASKTYSLTVNPPTISVSASAATLPAAAITSPYSESFVASGGTGPYTYILTGTLPAGFSLSTAGILSGTATVAGGPYTFTVTATDSSTGTGPYSGVSTTYSLRIGTATATITLGNLTQTYTGYPLSATATTVPSGLPVTFTYNGSATAPTAAGTYTVVATISNGGYAGSATGTMTINPITPAVSLSSSSNPAVSQTAVTFTGSVSATVGTPTGTVTFLDGSTPLGQGTLTAGVATLITSSLTDGNHALSALYNGDTNFVAASSAGLSQSIVDFNLTPGSGSGGGSGSTVTTQTAAPGGSATYPLTVVPSAGTIFPTPILLTVTGAPPGATPVISPSSWTQLTANSWTFPANTALPSMTLTIQLAPTSAAMNKKYPAPGKFPPMLWGILLLPFVVRARRVSKRLRGIIVTLLLAASGSATLFILDGCVSGNGFFGHQQSTYTVTVTATSGSLKRSTNLTLNVE